MLTVAVLGPVELHADGERLAVPSGKPTEVLVRLALDAGHLVRTDTLIDDLWGDATGTGRNTVQSKVSQLRRVLGAHAVILGGNEGYTLELDPACVDALAVVDLAAAVASARRAGDTDAAVELATQALSAFRGEPLVDAGEGAWLLTQRVRLDELRVGLVEDLFGARIDGGAGAEVIAELDALVSQHPLREGLWASLITALYRAGRQADALAAYARVREVLLEELGLDPGPALQELHHQVLQQSAALVPRGVGGPGGPPAASTSTTLSASAGNLPSLTSPLVGRSDERGAVDELLHERRLVTLVGPAGVGKTRLAIEVARAFEAPGGVWLIRLDGTDASTPIAQTVAETLQLSGGEQMLLERVTAAETVLVFDNCEHVVDAVADLIGRLLDATTGLRVLATSQLPLGLDGETVVPLEPLGIEASTELFAGRAAEIRRQFVLDEDTAAVVHEVCRSLDGLPLAIELAAARVKSLSVQEIARRLDDRFALLQDPTSRRPERRRTLASAIAWSYDLLFPDDQRGLWALSCFAGGAPLSAAEHVLAALEVPEAAVVDIVGRLADRSLVSVEVTAGGAVRYRLLDSIRTFAWDRLHESGLRDVACAAHAQWFARAADRCAATVRTATQGECLAIVRAERANIDAALAWSAEHDPLLGVRIANGFGWTWVVLGDGVPGAARMRAALSAAGSSVPAGDEVEAHLLAGWFEASAGNVAEAEADLDRALTMAEELADERAVADARRHLAFLRIQQGRADEVLELSSASLLVDRELGRVWEETASLLLRAFGSIMLGRVEDATRDGRRAAELVESTGDAWGRVHAEAMLGAIAHADLDFDEAATSLERAAAASEQLGFLGQAALHLTTLGRVLQRAGAQDAAMDTLGRAIEAAARSGDPRIAATARLHQARILRATDEDEAARALLVQVDRWYRSAGGGDGALLAQCLLAALDGDRATLTAVLDDSTSAADVEVQVLATDALARLAVSLGDVSDAAALLSTADDLASGIAHTLDDADRVDAHAARNALRLQ